MPKDIEKMTEEEMQEEFARLFQSLSNADQDMIAALIELFPRQPASSSA